MSKDLDQMTGPELMAYIAQFPTVDHYLDRDPYAQPLSDEELLLLVNKQRGERALFTLKEQKKRDKKAGIVDDTEETLPE
jgi:hypothetical protein